MHYAFGERGSAERVLSGTPERFAKACDVCDSLSTVFRGPLIQNHTRFYEVNHHCESGRAIILKGISRRQYTGPKENFSINAS
ncbi:hypothetical protein ACS0PU_010336 [Formica fusca]